MKRIILDQGLPSTAVILLREDGWDAVHVKVSAKGTRARLLPLR
jgi:hypothetical protein